MTITAGNLVLDSTPDPFYDGNQQPSLDLRFAESKTLNDYITGQNLITFSRDSSGTYVDSEGVIQMAGHNLLTYSEEFNNSAWFKINNPNVTVNDTLDPNGDQTADLISRTTNQTILYQLSPGAGTYVFSIYAKAGSSDLVTLASSVSFRGSAVTFNLSTGVPGSVVSYYNGSDATVTLSNPAMTDAGNGWWRCQVSVAHTVSRAVHVEPGDLTNTAASAYFWGTQLEKSAKVSPYLKTTTSTVAAPRFDHNPTTGESLGLLVEESRTNLLLRSEEFNDVSAWNVINLTVNPNAATAPDGQTTADLLTETTAPNANFYITQFTSVTSATTYTFSIRCKPNGRSRLYLAGSSQAWGAGFITFDLLNNVVSGSQGWTGTISSLPNGWYSITATQTTLATGAYNLALFLLNDSGNVTYTGDGTSSIYLWGAQLEEGSFPTSYIPTTGTALTRSADVASITGSDFSSWFNSPEGTLFTDLQTLNTSCFGWNLSDGSNNNRFVFDPGVNTGTASVVVSGGGTTFGTPPTVLAGGGKIAFAYKPNDYGVYGNQTQLAGTSPAAVPTGLNQIGLGYRGNYAPDAHLNGTISRFTYYPYRLADTRLQSLTA